MELAIQKETFALLEEELKKLELDTVFIEGVGGAQVGDTLRALLPMTDEGRPALMDFMAMTLDNGADVIQYYTTLTMELGHNRLELERAIPVFNFSCPLGSFGVFNKEQLYHKYGLLCKEGSTAPELAGAVLDGLSVVYDMLDGYYPLLMQLAGGELTYADAVDKGLLQPV